MTYRSFLLVMVAAMFAAIVSAPETVLSQQFEDMSDSISLSSVAFSSAVWGDYDNDSDLDVLLTGSSGTTEISKIYRNDSGSFSDAGAVVAGVQNGSAAWGDYDNDGDVDFLLTGSSGPGVISKIYRNDSNGFSDAGAALPEVRGGDAAWGDYDNDGDLDILLTGTRGVSRYTSIYRNDSGSFSDAGIVLPMVASGSVAWGDYDNDSDLDILLTGDHSSGFFTKIYRNNAGSFSDAGIDLPGVEGGSAAWGDYDNDSDLDVVVVGTSASGPIAKIYRNSAGSFTDAGIALPNATGGSAAWGDYDNDGDLDILLAGGTVTGSTTVIYNNSGGTFTNAGIDLATAVNGSAVWGDYDNDGDLDILLMGQADSAKISKIYRNNTSTPHVTPQPPTDLTTTVDGDDVTFSWNRPQQPFASGYTFNFGVGQGPKRFVISFQSTVDSDKRLIPALGNAQHNTSWTIKDIPPGSYYWSVQSVDQAFQGSLFAPGRTLTVEPQSSVEVTGGKITSGLREITPNPADFELRVTFALAAPATPAIGLYASDGRMIAIVLEGREYSPGSHEVTVNTEQLEPGVYTLRLVVDGRSWVRQVVVVR